MHDKIKTKIWSILPLVGGVILFVFIVFLGKIMHDIKLRRIVSEACLTNVQDSTQYYFKEDNGDIKIITLMARFDMSCNRKRINTLNSISIGDKYSNSNVKNMMIFYPDYDITDVNNFKRMYDLKFDCYVPNQVTAKWLTGLNINRSTYTIILGEKNNVLFADKIFNESEFYDLVRKTILGDHEKI